MFPQHAPGAKWKRRIRLEPWQDWIVTMHPQGLLGGLIHSDGRRDLNRVNGKGYARYSFSNTSEDIQALFCRACNDLAIPWTRPYRTTISIARATATARLDAMLRSTR